MEKTLDKIVALAKNRGFVYPGSEIYGGLANTWDYGNLGVELKNNVKKAWWKKFIQENPYNVGVDCAILMNPQTWVASGHLGGFADPLMDCKECHERFRADKLIEDYMADNGIEIEGSIDGWTNEQMELEFFCEPGTDMEWFRYWREFCINWLKDLGIKDDEMRARDHSPEELCFYSKGTTDIEFLFPFGWGELWGIADRTDYDLKQHQNTSGEPMEYFDDEKKEKYIPYVVEPSLGADRVTLAFLCAAYDEENIGTEEKPDMRTVLHFHPALAPVKIGVLPLSKKLNEGAEKIYAELAKTYNCEFDDRGNIGKRYRRQDEIGTPFCVTYDFESETDGAVTVRDRDTMEQERVKIEDLKAYFEKKFEY